MASAILASSQAQARFLHTNSFGPWFNRLVCHGFEVHHLAGDLMQAVQGGDDEIHHGRSSLEGVDHFLCSKVQCLEVRCGPLRIVI